MRLLWLTDLHLEFTDEFERESLERRIQSAEFDRAVVTGDISNAKGLQTHLPWLAKVIEKPTYFVLGNHDYYHGSFQSADESVALTCASGAADNLIHLGKGEVMPLTSHSALIGCGGWGDGLAGSGERSKVQLNDFVYIADLSSLDKQSLLKSSRRAGGRMETIFDRYCLWIWMHTITSGLQRTCRHSKRRRGTLAAEPNSIISRISATWPQEM